MNFIHGEYEVSVDAKGRFLLPMAFKKQLPEGAADKFIINMGFEQCLNMYFMDVWNTVISNLAKLNDFQPEARAFKRMMLSGVTEVTPDSADRILLPKSLMERANIKKDMILTGQGNKVELWDKDTYLNYLKQHGDPTNYSQMAAAVAGGMENLFNKN